MGARPQRRRTAVAAAPRAKHVASRQRGLSPWQRLANNPRWKFQGVRTHRWGNAGADAIMARGPTWRIRAVSRPSSGTQRICTRHGATIAIAHQRAMANITAWAHVVPSQ
eukprot:15028983-Alexandrium_andersonii.AAC.1